MNLLYYSYLLFFIYIYTYDERTQKVKNIFYVLGKKVRKLDKIIFLKNNKKSKKIPQNYKNIFFNIKFIFNSQKFN